MKRLKILIALLLVGLLTMAGVYFFIYNKPHTNFEKASPAFTMEAAELYQEFTSNQVTAEEQYNGKVIQLSGTLDSVEKSADLHIAVFAFEDGLFGKEGIRCTLLENHVEQATALMDTSITLKGFLTGYSGSDVILEHCSVIQ